MTRDEILAMKPGPELDSLVARKLFVVLNPDSRWRPSEDISAAWEVVEMFSYIDIHRYDDCFACAIYPIGSSAVIRARGKTMPEAICKAALLAVMDGEDEHERD